jgi:hypothetical protein
MVSSMVGTSLAGSFIDAVAARVEDRYASSRYDIQHRL